jgi:nucleoside-diphosphate-sugar epimerase
MAGTNVLVTGGSGRIGRRLVERLLEGGDKVTVIDTRHGDLKDAKYITASLNEVSDLKGIQVVYHLAASINYKASKGELQKLNVDSTAQLLKLCKGCGQFIFMSTTSVYGESKEPLTEESPTRHYTNYGWSKLECEKLVKSSGVPYTIIRSSQVYGPDFEEGYVDVLKRMQKGKMRIFGKGDNRIPLVHVDDLVDALVLVKGNKKALNQIFNVDGAYGKTQAEFMETAAAVMGAEPPAAHMSPLLAKLLGSLMGKGALVSEYIDKLTKNRQMSVEKMRRINFHPKVTLKTGMKQTITAFKQRGLVE